MKSTQTKIEPKERDKDFVEKYKTLEQSTMEVIKKELDEKYKFSKNINDILGNAQKAVQAKCTNEIMDLQRFSNLEEGMKPGQQPVAKPGKEKEFKEATNNLNLCQKPVMDKLGSFKAVTEMMSAFSIRSSDFCLDDCEEEVRANRGNQNFNATNCIKDCLLSVKYNSLTLGKFVEAEKKNLIQSFYNEQKM